MILMDTYIATLYKKGLIDRKHALEKVIDQEAFRDMLRAEKTHSGA
jgi:hypothetical protein